MTAHADERKFCPAVNNRKGWRCDFAEHPGNTHATWVKGYPQPWSSATEGWGNEPLNSENPLRDAPEALRGYDRRSGAYEVGSPAHEALERQIQDEQSARDIRRGEL